MRLRTVAAAVAVAMTLAACAGTGGEETADDEAVTGSSAVVEDAEPDDEVIADGDSSQADADHAAAEEASTDGSGDPDVQTLSWTAQTIDGDEFVAADLAGEHVVLWMWAPWCGVCNREAPEVAEVLADLPDDVTVIGVAGRDDVGPMQDFVAEHGLEQMTHVVDEDGSLWASYGVSYQPAWVFIDGDGEASVAAGALGYDGVLEGVESVFGA